MGFEVGDRIGEIESGDIDPRKVGRFMGSFEVHVGQIGNRGGDEIAIGAKGSEEFLTPVLGATVGGFTSGETEGCDFGDEPESGAVEALAKLGIGNDRERAAETGNIVGLAGAIKVMVRAASSGLRDALGMWVSFSSRSRSCLMMNSARRSSSVRRQTRARGLCGLHK